MQGRKYMQDRKQSLSFRLVQGVPINMGTKRRLEYRLRFSIINK